LCIDQVVEAYEAARFGTKEFTQEEFAVFGRLFQLLYQELEAGAAVDELHLSHTHSQH